MKCRYTVVFLLLCLCPFLAMAQPVTMKNGNVLKGDSVYCLYETDEYEYPAYIFSGTDLEQVIFADARDLSLVTELYVMHYYRIRFPQMEEELCIKYHPFRMQYLIEDMVKYHVFVDGHWNPVGTEMLIAAWKKKLDYLPPEKIAAGTSIASNPGNNHTMTDSLLQGISFLDNLIYRGIYIIRCIIAGHLVHVPEAEKNYYR